MNSQVTSANGITPITSAPPSDVPPSIVGYGMSLGVIEASEPGMAVPVELQEGGLIEYLVTYEFLEYAIVLQSGVPVQVPLGGQTIDWSASEISGAGSVNIQFGVVTHYDLAGRAFSEYQYTYLAFACVLIENGVEKSASWTVRMKHF